MRTLLASLVVVSASLPLAAQDPAPASAVQPEVKPLLTPEQKEKVLLQLEEIERAVLAQRGGNLGAIIQRLHLAAGTSGAALNLIEDCEKMIIDRQGGDRDDERRLTQRMQQARKSDGKKEEEKDGVETVGLRLALEYLALTLEASQTRDVSQMIPKLLTYHQKLLSNASKLKGATGNIVDTPVNMGGGRGGRGVGVVVEALRLQPFMPKHKWPLRPGSILETYSILILPVVRETRKQDLAATWDNALAGEATFQKERLAEGEYELWQKDAYPELRWQRARDIHQFGDNPVFGLAEMLKVIKDFSFHASAPEWIVTLRGLVDPAKLDELPPAAPVAQ